MWSLELQAMFRPSATYRRLAAELSRASSARLWHRPLLLGLVLSAFLSWTTTGELTLRLVVDGLLFWSFLPALNVGLALLLPRLGGARRPSASASVEGLFVSFGPWLLWLLGVAALAAWTPSAVLHPFRPWPALPYSIPVLLGWSGWIQLRYLRTGLGMRVGRALCVLVAMKAIAWGAIVLWFLLTDQLEPRLAPPPGVS